MNKKGTGLDYLNVPFMLFITILFFVVGYFIISSVQDGFSNLKGDSINKSLAVEHLSQGKSAVKYFDYLFLFLVFGLTISLWISAYYINTNPVFFWVSVILLFVVIILGAIFNNIYYKISQTGLSDSVEAFPIINYIMSHIGLFIAFILISSIVIIYAKGGGGGYTGGY